MKRRDPNVTIGGLDLVEQAMHMLRLAPAATLLCYFVGSVPFVLAVLFYWSDMSRSGLADRHLVPGAIGLALLFVWMKVWQSIFATRLAAQVANEPPPRFHAAQIVRMIGSQTFLQSTGLILLPVAANILLPFGWVYALYQNATALGGREPALGPLLRRSWKQARHAPGQNHTGLSLLLLFGFFVFLNVMITMMATPFLVKMLLGVESSFTLSPMSSLNTTFLAAAAGVTYLCFDPIVKSFYALRCFYGEARTTGEDLRVTLRSFQTPALAVLLALAVLRPGDACGAGFQPDGSDSILLPVSSQAFISEHGARMPRELSGWKPDSHGVLANFAAMAATANRASVTPATKPDVHIPPETPSGEILDHSIDEVLKRAEYTWRTPRENQAKAAKEESAMWERIRNWMRDTWRAFADWIDKVFKNRSRSSPAGKFSFSSEGLIYLLIAAVIAIIGVLVYVLWHTRSNSTRAEMEATPSAPLPDLERDDVSGDELPVDGWAKLALELLERGELRLAMRAFYLSSLAHLAGRNLVSIARFKSNRDYERELSRRSHALPELTQHFAANVLVFDRVWYGRHDIDADLLQQFRSNVERIRAC